ncbi:hypothetical protein C8A05DRAFT_43809 [Staphylotrichum tortipilum]|uniref:O-methyltransferase C-terminal domain-containing protein n=1 Tax=Staphylotrichum tortipilum TaxID=2831512 RepID=A0AAN6MKZ9_9PEZI|nr:hypothetical protein C8A05DRAFT_43809 [Staphylotrichum longicolle]
MSTPPHFDLLKAAEGLLEQARALAARTKPEEDDNDLELRRSIAATAKRITIGTAPRIDVVKADWIVISEVAAWNIFIDWKAFDHIPLDGYISISDLAKALNAQESLIARISTLLLTTHKLLPGPHPHTLTHSRVSPLYRTSHPVSPLCSVAIGNGMKPFSHWPEYFRLHGRREPSGQHDTPFSFGWGEPTLPPWDVKARNKEYGAVFARSMRSREIVGGDTVVSGPGAVYDMAWVGREAKTRGDTEVVVVDVGGGLGQLLGEVLRGVEGIRPGQCVLQDRGEVVEEVRRMGGLGGVVVMEHDFHEEQPVKGGLVYLLRRILLDYSDSLAVGILRRLADALPADNPKARVLIMEERLLETPTPQNCIVDLVMLNLGGKLRNEAIYRDICAQAGLKVVGYHTREGDSNSVVECTRA